MVDLAELRKNPEWFTQEILKKDPSFDTASLISLDVEFRQLSIEVESLRKEKNDLAKQASGGISQEVRNYLLQMRQVS